MNSFVLFDQLDEFYSKLIAMIRAVDLERSKYKEVFNLKFEQNNETSLFKYTYTMLGKDDIKDLVITVSVFKREVSEKEYWIYAKKGIGKLADRSNIHLCYTTIKFKSFYQRIEDIYFLEKENIFFSNDDDINSNIVYVLNRNKDKIN